MSKAIPHPAYNPDDRSNDIMLLKVRPAVLPHTYLHLPFSTHPSSQPWCLCSAWCRVSPCSPSVTLILSFFHREFKCNPEHKTCWLSWFLLTLPYQLVRKAKRTKAVKPLNLPRRNAHVKPGDVCYVAGWGKTAPDGEFSNTLQEVKLTVQKDQVCESQFRSSYNKASEICAGDSKMKGASFEVSWIAFNSRFSWRGKESGTYRHKY